MDTDKYSWQMLLSNSKDLHYYLVFCRVLLRENNVYRSLLMLHILFIRKCVYQIAYNAKTKKAGSSVTVL